MKSTLFVTGATGFVGTSMLKRLEGRNFETVFCLTRSKSDRLPRQASSVKPVVGDLFDVRAYEPALACADTVLHLAAATGSAPTREHFRVNAEGTELLLRQCEVLGVKRFLFVSSIAARFTDIRDYPYAQSKLRAEQAVRQSRLRYTIVRPTIILGRGSAVGQRLQSLARGAITPVIGNGNVQVQPIDVDDLADVLLAIIASDRFNAEVLELGGPETLTMNALLARMHQAQKHTDVRLIHLPVGPLRAVLRLLGRLPVRLPVSPGQLASFVNDGTASPNDLTSQRRSGMKKINEMITQTMPNGSGEIAGLRGAGSNHG